MVDLSDAPHLGLEPSAGGNFGVLARRISGLRLASAASIVALISGLCATLARDGLHWDQETALYPWLMNHGWVLYRDIRDQHGPLFPSLLSVLPDPGSAGTQFVVMLMLVACTALLIAVAAWRVSGPLAALIGVGLYSIWILPFDGAHVWYDLGLAPFYLAALLVGWELLNRRGSNWAPVVLGLLMSLAFLLKQQAAVALVAGLALSPFRSPRPIALYLAAASLPVLISVLAFSSAGTLGDYVYWVVTYNLSPTYVQGASAPIPSADWPLLLAVSAPVLALAVSPKVLQGMWKRQRGMIFFAAGLLIAATLPVWPRYARFHLAGALPLLALFGGIAIWKLLVNFPGIRSRALLPWAAGVMLILFSLRLTGPSGVRALNAVWQSQPATLPFSSNIGPLRDWVQSRTPVDQPILVYDLDSTLYRVLERQPPKPWSPFFPWILEGDSTAKQWVEGIEIARPRIALVTPEFVAGRHLPIPDGGKSEDYLRANYVAGPVFTVQKYAESGEQNIVALELAGP
jgi:hypothetical protein